jgi:Cys-tRNA(Pro)/Cys-tRNA(Cys) deacylase
MSGVKTNPMRVLDRAGVTYTVHIYKEDSGLTGSEIAEMLGEDPERVFKTLVTIGNSGRHFVFVVPVSKELDLKRAAASVSEKSVSMIPASQLQSVTGYVHGGCSPFSMKHPFVTVVDSSVT